jgi:hypothetical protein
MKQETRENLIQFPLMLIGASIVLAMIIGIGWLFVSYFMYIVIIFGIAAVLFVLHGAIKFKHEMRKKK